MRTLSAELVDDVGGVAPVGVDETAADFHGGSVVAFPFATKDVFGGNQMGRKSNGMEFFMRYYLRPISLPYRDAISP